MLPSSHLQPYETFKQILKEVKDTLFQDTVDRGVLRGVVAKLQDYFHDQILVLDLTELEPKLEQQVQAFQVEINKQLKLLSMDATFLQAAKQASTVEQRLNQAGDRLTLLLRYCEALLNQE
ncbi:MAG: heterocyst frequency control protein PatD [Oscillatoriales cyanobacterium C42_A2020_001]|nr:heterocyst frequency control protein PatD [Leptolyngbyaceae cyanobacterium C42_A2020_001]